MTSFAKSRITRLLCLSLVTQMVITPVWADPSQVPLLSSFGSRPKPNFMLTLDTSGSMNFRHMPEEIAGSLTYVMHPLDTYAKDTNYAGVVRANNANDNLLQRKMRSPDVNTIYYNPEVLYRPWRKAAGGYFDDAVYTKAFINPLSQAANSTAINLSQVTTLCLQRNNGGDCTSSESFNPGIVYRLRPGQSRESIASYDFIDLNAPATTTYEKYPARTDCTGARCTQEQERKNFANWFVYYRTRLLLTKAALSEAFASTGNVARVGWTTIARASNLSQSAILQPLRELDDTHKVTLLNAVQGFNASGGTPLRVAMFRVGEYFRTSPAPWYNDPDNTAAGSSACRRSYNLLTTDGYYNDHTTLQDNSSLRVGDVDKVSSPKVPSTSASRPYQDTRDNRNTYSNTLADYALYFWKTDLNANLANNLRPISGGDPATWQHLSQFTISIGLSGSLTPNSTTLDELRAGTRDWPDPNPGGSTAGIPAKIDDLWHAAVNSHGAFYTANDANQLVTALRSAIDAAGEAEQREAGVVTTLPSISSNNRIYVPEYRQGSWTGDIRAYTLNESGARSTSPVWQASLVALTPSSRNLFIRDGSSTVPFTTAGVSTTTKSAMAVTVGTADDLINYLRGDTSKEGSGATQYRVRERAYTGATMPALPDFVDSNPVLVKGNVDMSYGSLPEIGSGYAAFLASKAARSPVIFIGGNGGFLHAFSDRLNGQEIFGYAPKAAIPNLKILADRDYGLSGLGKEHRFFVDGPLVESDAYFSMGGQSAWRNVLIAALGAGGKGLFALRLDTDNVELNLGANSVLWDLTGGTDADMGYIYADAQVGVLPNGQWKVFVGNGFGSTNGSAVLYMIDVADGSVTKLAVGTAGSNGLGGVALVRNSLQQVVAAYAGDLQGQLWRFDYDTTTGAMRRGYDGNPLFRATATDGSRQPITAAPLVVSNPSGGQVVVFGTGRLIEESDRNNSTLAWQTLYGVQDPVAADNSTANSVSPFAGPTADRTLLSQRTIADAGTSGGVQRYSVVATAPTPGVETYGWYIDLTIARGQRVVYPLQSVASLLLASTVVPAAASEECSSASGAGYNFVLKAVTGTESTVPVLDTNGDGVVNRSDSTAAGYTTRADGRDVIIRRSTTTTGNDGSTTTKTDFQICNTQNCMEGEDSESTNPVVRVIRDRVWKRLINNVPTP